jgi:flavin reductase (DIM6/NTAB) family NADH-FMN oxidoreductase RutF
MYYDPRINNHNLAHNPFNALVVPRPIGWITTISRAGVVNLAPYSYFNAVSANPPMLMFSSSGLKDSQRNAEASGEFVASLATFELREAMNLSSATVAPEVSEPQMIGLQMASSVVVRPPRVQKSPWAFECKYVKTVDLPGLDGKPSSSSIVIGAVVSIYIDDAFIVDGMVDTIKAQPIARLGYVDEYAVIDHIFRMRRPD